MGRASKSGITSTAASSVGACNPWLARPPCRASRGREQPVRTTTRCTLLTNPAETNELTGRIIGCSVQVHRVLGPGLLELSYVPCLAFELKEAGMRVELKKAVPLVYRNIQLDACYYLDMLVNGTVIVELKSVADLAPIHKAQMLTYLKLTGCPVGLLMNFNVEVLKDGVRRIINPQWRPE